jgi:hypothetical protein
MRFHMGAFFSVFKNRELAQGGTDLARAANQQVLNVLG